MAELEVRVETLEGTAADHDTKISAAEMNIEGKCFQFDVWELSNYGILRLSRIASGTFTE